MLNDYVSICKGNISPFGSNLYSTDDIDPSWKKRKLVVTANAAVNRYNLVQIEPSSRDQKEKAFKIQNSPQVKPKPKKATASPPAKSSSLRRERDLESRKPFTPAGSKTMKPGVPMFPPNDKFFSGSSNSQNVQKPSKQQLQPQQSDEEEEEDEYVDVVNDSGSDSEGYENWTVIKRQEDIIRQEEDSDDAHEYVNWQ